MTDNLVSSNPQNHIHSERTETKMVTSRIQNDTSPRKSGRSYGSKRSTLEEELRSLSTTPRMSHEDFGRVVSPPTPDDKVYEQAIASLKTGPQSGSTQTLLQLELKEAKALERKLEKRLKDIDEERRDVNVKLAGLRVKLGVANANFNVCKTECDQLRKKLQETQIKQARLEERIDANGKELARLTDPNNPDSNVNIKKTVLNDRKEIKSLRTSLEGTRAERSELQKQIEQRNSRIRDLNIDIKSVKNQLDTCQSDFEVARVSSEAEREKREEVEAMYRDMLEEKEEFDKKIEQMHNQKKIANAETSEVKKHIEQLIETEQKLLEKMDKADRQLREILTNMEQEKNADMPLRTASSIKGHQYRMSRGGAVTDTTPRVVITTNSNSSPAISGMGRGVVTLKPSPSVTSLPGSKPNPPRIKPASLSSKK